jgi:hypothetical protein
MTGEVKDKVLAARATSLQQAVLRSSNRGESSMIIGSEQ